MKVVSIILVLLYFSFAFSMRKVSPITNHGVHFDETTKAYLTDQPLTKAINVVYSGKYSPIGICQMTYIRADQKIPKTVSRQSLAIESREGFSPDTNALIESCLNSNYSPTGSPSTETDSEVEQINIHHQNSAFEPWPIRKKESTNGELSQRVTPSSIHSPLTLRSVFYSLVLCEIFIKNVNNPRVDDLATVQLADLRSLNLKGKKIEEIFEDSDSLLDLMITGLVLKNFDYEKYSVGFKPKIKLTTLNLSDNIINEIPEELYEITTLEELDLSHNKISKLSEGISQLENLKTFNLDHNKFRSIPLSLVALGKLATLNFTNNQLVGLPPLNEFKKLKKLKTLDVRKNSDLVITPGWIQMGELLKYDPDHSQCVTPEPIVPEENRNEGATISPSSAAELCQLPLSSSDLNFVRSSIKAQSLGSR